MKARVKSTGKIISIETNLGYPGGYVASNGATYRDSELELIVDEDPDYWTRLEHQYAGMAMQGMLSNTTLITVLFDATKDHDELLKEVIICSHEYAHALVEKMKEEK